MNRKHVVVADSSPLIALLNIGRFHLLEALFSTIIVPERVAAEIACQESPDSAWFAAQEAGYVRVTPLQPDPRLAILLLQIDAGEAEAILLADQLTLPLLIDDKAGRQMAMAMGLQIIGLAGVLAALNQLGVVKCEELGAILEDLERVEFRLSAALKQRLLTQV